MSKSLYAVVALIAAVIGTSAAYVHPKLQSAEHPAGKSSAPPKEIRIHFSESILPKFSGIELEDQTGKAIAIGKTTNDPADRKNLIAPLINPLSPGDYTVDWHAVSGDTHRVKGSYSFGVAR